MPTQQNELDLIIGQNITNRLNAIDMTLETLARKTGKTKGQLTRYIAAKEPMPATVLLRIGDVLNVYIYSLFGQAPSLVDKFAMLSKSNAIKANRFFDNLMDEQCGVINSTHDDY